MARDLKLTNEDAYLMSASLVEKLRFELEGCEVFSGILKDHGNVTIVIPAIGEALLIYPFELH